MKDIKTFNTNEYYSRIINDFKFVEYKEIKINNTFKELFNELYLFKSKNGDSYYIASSKKNILDKIEEKKLPLLIIYHCKSIDIYMFSSKCEKYFE